MIVVSPISRWSIWFKWRARSREFQHISDFASVFQCGFNVFCSAGFGSCGVAGFELVALSVGVLMDVHYCVVLWCIVGLRNWVVGWARFGEFRLPQRGIGEG
ncbi:hypothetical protein KC19_VG235500 [Ceratodon purpureus]|uniref:Uncharacterized protein n=1 Tax=Ceratodon purpureus TaxID=3225 RepID=A0A8T0HTQ6_CERPU|nr:hypothetical protein KC19_VG235500 [Ceratodon purpureus]